MVHPNWSYLYLTNKDNLNQFEEAREIIINESFTDEANDIINSLIELRGNANYDTSFMEWMTADSWEWEETKKLSEELQDYSLEHNSLKYSHSLIGNLLSFYCLFPRHRRYCFIKHGYPISVDIKLTYSNQYIVFKEFQETYETALITDLDLIHQILSRINMPILDFLKKEDFKVSNDTILLLQYNND